MEILVDCNYRESDVRAAFDPEALARFVLERESVSDQAEVSISFVEDDEIHSLNREYRGIDRPTDVLSFECDGYDDDFGFVEGEIFELGDIVIAPDVAERQSAVYGQTFGDELSLLLTHGLLHLCGYDHIEEDDALVMEEREHVLLSEYFGRPFAREARL